MIPPAQELSKASKRILVRQRRSSTLRAWYHGGQRRRLEDDIPGTIGKPVGVTHSFLGGLLLEREEERERQREGDQRLRGLSREPRSSYHHKYQRGLATASRRLRAVDVLRYGYRLPMQLISQALGVSSRTVFQDDQVLRGSGRLAFDGASCRRSPSKKTPGIVNTKGVFLSLRSLVIRLRSFMLGLFSTIEEALGDDPP